MYKDAFDLVLRLLCSDDNEHKSGNSDVANSSDQGKIVDIMENWQITLTEKFRLSKCDTLVLDALYVCSGVVLSATYEDISLSQSVHKVSEQLRSLQYRVLLGLEEQLECVEVKCYGLVANNVTEY
ncbi:hypothetical protein FBUS_10134 [Fasciolopsis buskii]|uniref:Uncharacterized protein n=1 Tax=Fasciolopsis buskii TaxID=27845 RepID=A0A8E0RK85_9TREM|nr:hypothetical protein FBUS_10134 [Fasciolopsis buski]